MYPVIYEGTPEAEPYRWHGHEEPANTEPHVWVSKFRSQHSTYGGGSLGSQDYCVLVIGKIGYDQPYRHTVPGHEHYDPDRTNQLGRQGAYVSTPPTDDEVAKHVTAAQRAIARWEKEGEN